MEEVKTEQDVQAMCALAEEIWHEHFTDIIGEAQVNYMVDKFQSVHAVTAQLAEGYRYFMLKKDNCLIGYTGIHVEDGALFLSKLYIQKSSRGNGFARQALEFLEQICRERRLGKIWLTVNKHNDNTIAVYNKLGFHTVREQKADIGNGFFMDDFIMEKEVLCQ